MKTVIDLGKAVLAAEAEAILEVREQLGASYESVVDLILARQGKIVCIGVGKSAIIAQKFCATLSSLGLPAVFMHAADGPHGDLGVVAQGDIAFLLSYTGRSYELLANIRSLNALGARTVAITGAAESPLAEQCEKTLLCTVSREADALNLAPSSSSTAMLALCDAIAIGASHALGFTHQDFALRHPGGTLGRRLTWRVRDLPLQAPIVVGQDDSAAQVLMGITSSRAGAVLVASHGSTPGLITDGDVRRAIQANGREFFDLVARDMMTVSPVTISGAELVADALEVMEQRASQISILLVEDAGKVSAIARIHDLLGAGHALGRKP